MIEGMEHIKHFRMANATAILPNGTLHVSSVPNSYYSYPDYSDFIIAHIILMTVGWLFVLPIGIFPVTLAVKV